MDTTIQGLAFCSFACPHPSRPPEVENNFNLKCAVPSPDKDTCGLGMNAMCRTDSTDQVRQWLRFLRTTGTRHMTLKLSRSCAQSRKLLLASPRHDTTPDGDIRGTYPLKSFEVVHAPPRTARSDALITYRQISSQAPASRTVLRLERRANVFPTTRGPRS